MITSDKFIDSIDDIQLRYYFGPGRNSFENRVVIEEVSPEEETKDDI